MTEVPDSAPGPTKAGKPKRPRRGSVAHIKSNKWKWLDVVLSEHGPASPTMRLVLVSLWKHMDQKGYAWPSHKTLARRSGLSERCVGDHIRRAEREGWLRIGEREQKGAAWRSHAYVATVPPGTETPL